MKLDFNFDTGSDDATAAPARSGSDSQPLAGLREGAGGRIVSVEVSAVDLERLEVMGLCAGRFVQVIKQGDPMIVRVLETRIGLAAELARAVRVRPDPDPSRPD